MTTTTTTSDEPGGQLAALRRAILSGDNTAAAAVIDGLRDAGFPAQKLSAELIGSARHAAAYMAAGVPGARTSPASGHPAAEPPAAVAGPASAQAQPPGLWSLAAEHAAAAEKSCEPYSGTSLDARAITHALLYAGAVIEGAAERLAEDVDAAAAMLDDRLTSIEAVIDPAVVLPRPRWRRVAARLRRRPR